MTNLLSYKCPTSIFSCLQSPLTPGQISTCNSNTSTLRLYNVFDLNSGCLRYCAYDSSSSSEISPHSYALSRYAGQASITGTLIWIWAGSVPSLIGIGGGCAKGAGCGTGIASAVVTIAVSSIITPFEIVGSAASVISSCVSAKGSAGNNCNVKFVSCNNGQQKAAIPPDCLLCDWNTETDMASGEMCKKDSYENENC